MSLKIRNRHFEIPYRSMKAKNPHTCILSRAFSIFFVECHSSVKNNCHVFSQRISMILKNVTNAVDDPGKMSESLIFAGYVID